MEIKGWVQERALDLGQESIATIEQTLQSHEILENEININSDRISRFLQRGENLQYPSNYQNRHITEGIIDVSNEWSSLQKNCLLKRNILSSDLSFIRLSFELDKILSWLSSTKIICESQDLGKDLSSASHIQKTLLSLDHHFEGQKHKFFVISKNINEIFNDGSNNLDILNKKVVDLALKFETLLPIYQKRITMVNQSCISYNFLLEIADEHDWIDEKSTLIRSCLTSNDLIRSQKVFKKFELLFADFQSRENRVLSLQEQHEENIYIENIPLIEKEVENLSSDFSQLKKLCCDRKDILLRNIALQHYFSNCMEAFVWLKDKETILISQRLGKVSLNIFYLFLI